MKLRERYRKLSLWNKLGVWGALASLVSISLAVLFYVFQTSPSVPMEHYGFLYPANDPTPPNPCGASGPETVLVLIGDNAFRLTGREGHFIAIRLQGKPLVWLERSSLGIHVSAEVTREDGRLAAKINANRFVINPNNYFTMRRPDRHELSVYDKSSQVVLKARFLNEGTFRIEGRFFAPGYGSVIVENDAISARLPGGHIQARKACMSNVSVGLDL
ncbi:hypothetical protein EPO44_00285 [bacterium]|nr:MAG: hypothetical protein EPO44_00285 [bacterium]